MCVTWLSLDRPDVLSSFYASTRPRLFNSPILSTLIFRLPRTTQPLTRIDDAQRALSLFDDALTRG
jgi:hypothetical protein